MKKQLIIEQALELFAEQGFEATSVQQITDRCGISKGAFYLSFKSKDELIVGLIDYFIQQFISQIDRSVRLCEKRTEKLYTFFHTAFQSFEKQAKFAVLFMKEPPHPLNKELYTKLVDYDSRINDIILAMLDDVYGTPIHTIRYDMLFCIKAFMKIHSEFVMHHGVYPDLEAFSRSLVEKTEIVARHSKLPFITPAIAASMTIPKDRRADLDELLALMELTITEISDPIEWESLTLLQEHIQLASPSKAILLGLLANLQHNPHCRWISYLIRQYVDGLTAKQD